ncbi:MAG: response regulator [Alphaproteobacteria bacterium]|nr:response regulator [Alphaproteobacteria bacterium]
MKALQKVLVVDDDAVVGRSFDRVLTDKGYDVSTALDGEEALEKCGAEAYDVVFTDIRMPGMDGLEVARRIKAKCPWTPVVIITGYGTEENESEARVLGVNGFLRKPLTPAMIEGITLKALKDREVAPAAQPDAAAIAVPLTEAAVTETVDVTAQPETLKDILRGAGKVGLFIAAPFIGLAYALFLPFFGLALLAWLGARALLRYGTLQRFAGFLKNVALFVAAPFIGLAYALLLPFVGLGVLVWMGFRMLVKQPEPK